MSGNQEMVQTFHMGHDGGAPDFMLARRLIFEEMNELWVEMMTATDGHLLSGPATIDDVNRAAVIKEMADVMYVMYGFADRFGIDLDEAFRRVHESNMSKMVDGRTVLRSDGKVLKPDTWVAPDLSNL